MPKVGKEGLEILEYIDDPKIWKPWLMEGAPKPYQAAAYLTNWLANFDTGPTKYKMGFWTLRAAMFYDVTRWANYEVRGQWGKRAEFFDWDNFLLRISAIPGDTHFLLFPGKFRTLPTPTQVDGLCLKLKELKNSRVVSALVFEPRENVVALEGKKVVLDDRIRTWAYSQLPIDIITRFPIVPEGEELSQFYTNRYHEIRRAKSGYIGVGVGISDHRDKIISGCRAAGIDIVDTSIENAENLVAISLSNTTDFDRISSRSELANELILKFLQNMGQI